MERVLELVFFVIGKIIRGFFELLFYTIVTAYHAIKTAKQPPFTFSLPSRFEHMHIVAGSGHGKTQLLQALILDDLIELEKGNGSIIVIDSQGDMIKNILHLQAMETLSDRLILIDPHDVEHLPALNLFDFGLERLEKYDAVEREKLIK